MARTTQRGRAAKTTRTTPMLRNFYILLGLIVVAGIAVVGTATLRRDAPAAVGTASYAGSDLPAKGSASAPVTVVEYADFQCPGCGAFATQMEAQFTRDYIDTGKVRMLYHDFPLQQHPNAIPAAEAARCAAQQNAFWPMHDMLFARQDAWSTQSQPLAAFLGYADALKLDRTAFQSCMEQHSTQPAVLAARQASMNASIMQTPTFVINGRQYDATQLRSAVDAALGAQGK